MIESNPVNEVDVEEKKYSHVWHSALKNVSAFYASDSGQFPSYVVWIDA